MELGRGAVMGLKGGGVKEDQSSRRGGLYGAKGGAVSQGAAIRGQQSKGQS